MICNTCNRHIDDRCNDCDTYKTLDERAHKISDLIKQELECYEGTGRKYGLVNLKMEDWNMIIGMLEDV